MALALIDTDTLNEILKAKNSSVIAKAANYLAIHGRFSISAITRYELLRGLKEKNAYRQLTQFAGFCCQTNIIPVTDQVFDRAAELWVAARRLGRIGSDADLLIAATALDCDIVLVTGNTRHFDWIPTLQVENWRLS